MMEAFSCKQEQHQQISVLQAFFLHMKVFTFLLLLLLFSIASGAQDWGNLNYKGVPWVSNVSKPYRLTQGLEGRHLAIWASHGCYYDNEKDQWKWQRPTLFGTTEDLFTQTIVVPYLIPMLERSGAVVYTPRERDWQRHEIIVDNDDALTLIGYQEIGYRQLWHNTPLKGFAYHKGNYIDGENPFESGTARMTETTTSHSKRSSIIYQPSIPEAGSYAVYVSYQTLEGSTDDARYSVWHQGQETRFRVNQRMGGSTWVYLGTFDFDEGCNEWNCVVLTNESRQRGAIVTSDAVRFGGGMGNIERGGKTSGLPRALEGARYSCQWAGMPFNVYSSKSGQNDYGDDINARSLSENLLAGGSCYLPGREGRGVPIELSVAVHSDAGFHKDGTSVYGALTIHTTRNDNDTTIFDNGLSRAISKTLATHLLSNLDADVQARYGISWPQREVRDRNYSETRLPEVPSAIVETMSHQNFPDMRYGQDPNFKFTLARSLYKTIVRYVNSNHGENCVIAPLAPTHLKVAFSNRRKGEVKLSWRPTTDPQEPSADATGFVVYTATGSSGFDNGRRVEGNSYTLRLEPGVLYSFRVAALNAGGESFPTEVASALFNHRDAKTILVVNGFNRLSSPAFIDNDSLQGFLLKEDIGVTRGRTLGWAGEQTGFRKDKMGVLDSTGLGFGSTEMTGQIIAGNDFNYVRTHAEAIRQAGYYNILSCSADVLHELNTNHYDALDLLLGLQQNDGRSLVKYKTFTADMQKWLRLYTAQHHPVMVSGSYVGSDMTTADERQFLKEVLRCSYAGKDTLAGETVRGMGTDLTFYRTLNEHHYAAHHPDILQPAAQGAIPTMAYASGFSAAVAYSGQDGRAFTMGFPFECIKSEEMRVAIMKAVMNYLIK